MNAFSKCQLAGEATTDPLPVRRCGCLPLHCVEKSANQRIFLNVSLDSNFSLTWIHLQVPEGYTVAVSSVPGQPDALLVKAEEDTSRDGLLASLFPQEAVSLSRNYDVTYKVQCLVRHARCASMEADASMEWRGGLTSLSTPPVTATIPTGVGLEPSDHATSPSNDCSLFANSHVARRSTRSI